MSSATFSFVFLYVAFRLAEHGEAISTSGELETFCNGPSKKWSNETQTCVEHFPTLLNWEDSEDDCISAAPTSTKGRLLHPVGELIDVNSFFGKSLSGWVGGYQYVTYPTSWTPKTAIANYRWMEGGNCTTKFNASAIPSSLLTFHVDLNDRYYVKWNSGGYYYNIWASHDYRFCQYYLGNADPAETCDLQLQTVDELREYCNHGTSMKWSLSTQTCTQGFTDLKTWEDAELACIQAAPKGTTGRLVHATGGLTNLNDFYGLIREGWVGAVQHIKYPDEWIPKTSMSNYRWMESGKCTTISNTTEMVSEGLVGFYTDSNSKQYLCWVFAGYLVNRLATDTSYRFCEYYIGECAPESYDPEKWEPL